MEKSKFREHHTHPIEVYEAVQQIPILSTSSLIPDDKRRCTDILCIIVGLALTITLAVFAIITFNKRTSPITQPNTSNKSSPQIAMETPAATNTQATITFILPNPPSW